MNKNIATPLPEHDSILLLVIQFNNSFVDKVQAIRDNLDKTIETLSSNSSHLEDKIMPSHVFSNFDCLSEADIHKLIKLTGSKSCSLDPIPTKLLNTCIDVTIPTLTNIINTGLQSGPVPDSFKEALVRPIIKKRNLESV